jgi:hypothetical protein
MTYSRETINVVEIDVPQPRTGLVEDLTQRHRYHFQLGFEPRVIGGGQRVEQMILMGAGASGRSHAQSVLRT